MLPVTWYSVLCKSQAKAAPLKWFVDLNRVPFLVTFTCGFVTVLLITVHGVLNGSIDSPLLVGLYVLTFVSLASGALLTWLNVGHGVVAASTLAVLMVANSSLASITLFAADFYFRMRHYAIIMIIFKQLPATFGFPLPMTMVMLLWSLATDTIVLLLSSQIHNDPVERRMVLTDCILTGMYMGLAWMAQGRLRSLYDTLRELAAEKETLEALLAMVCDATAWVSKGRSTVARCDQRFDMLIGRGMQGALLHSCLPDDAAQDCRLQDAMTQAQHTPAMLPLTLTGECGAEITVDCFIVGRVGACMEPTAPRTSDKVPSFLMGLRTLAQNGGMVPEVDMGSDDIRARCEPSGVTRGQHPDDALTVSSSLPESTATGRVFSDLHLERWLGDAVDSGSNIRHRLQAVAELGSREGWLLHEQHIHLQPDQVLGAGSFGVVIAASLHGTPVAVKIPKLSNSSLNVKHLVSLANEVRILRHVRHPSVVLFHGACVEPRKGEILLVLERIHAAATLPVFVQKHCMPDDVCIRYWLLLQVVCALRYLHAQRPKVVHGDLKASNIVVEHSAPRIKLLDFGLSRLLTRSAKALGGTLSWMAPELIQKPRCLPEPSADVFSFSRLAYMLVACKEPLMGVKRETIIQLARKGRMHPLDWPHEAPLLSECRSLCEKILIFEAWMRPDMKEVHIRVSAWQLPEHETHAPPFEALRAESQLHGDSAIQADEERACHWQEGLRKVRDVVGRRLSASEGDLGPSLTLSQQQQRTALGEVPVEARSTGVERLFPFPEGPPTSLRGKQAVLLSSLMSWNYPIITSACCSYHALLQDLSVVSTSLARMACTEFPLPDGLQQCQACGVLDAGIVDGQYGCDWCTTSRRQNSGSNSLHVISQESCESGAKGRIVAL